MALTDRVSLLASRVAVEAKALWAALDGKAASVHDHDDRYYDKATVDQMVVAGGGFAAPDSDVVVFQSQQAASADVIIF